MLVPIVKSSPAIVRSPPITVSPATQREVRLPRDVTLPCAAVERVPVRVVADTVVSPLTVDGNPMVTVPRDSATSTSCEVPENVAVPPNEIAVVLEPSLIVIVELANLSLAIDDMLASMNSYGAGGTSYGVFDNSEDMALNLGFSGFRRGSYDFYKSDWKYLNDKATRGSINSRDAVAPIRGVIIPAGVSTVYDQMLGKNLKRPFLHVRYRASQTDDRRMKTWVTGSVGAVTSDLDAMQVHYLSERCLITQGANNFMLMK